MSNITNPITNLILEISLDKCIYGFRNTSSIMLHQPKITYRNFISNIFKFSLRSLNETLET